MYRIQNKKRTKQVRDAVQRKWHERRCRFINDNKDTDWEWWLISSNPIITIEDILNNPNNPWNWIGIAENPNITMSFILDNPDKPWVWSYISKNPNITMKDINNNPNEDWHWYEISKNPSITMKDINENPEKPWNWFNIYRNTFTKDKEVFIDRMYREHIAAILIQNAYKNAVVNEYCQIGKNRIERDMEFAGIEM